MKIQLLTYVIPGVESRLHIFLKLIDVKRKHSNELLSLVGEKNAILDLNLRLILARFDHYVIIMRNLVKLGLESIIFKQNNSDYYFIFSY
jgi:hypothetical protein